MQMPQHARLIALPLASLLVLTLATGATAQVATLSTLDPDAEPTPAAAEAELDILDRDDALLAYAQCLRDNGVEMDDPAAGERGGFKRQANDSDDIDIESEEFLVAQQICAPIFEAGRPDVDLEVEQERLESELLLAQCLRDNGYPQYPDPALDTDGRLQRGGQQFQDLGIDRRSEEFQDARATCASELGVEDFGPGGGSARGGN